MNDFDLVDKYYTAMFTDFSDIVTVKDACVMLHMGRKKIYELIKSGRLELLNDTPDTSRYLITKRSIIKYVIKA